MLIGSTKHPNYHFIRLGLADQDAEVNFMVEMKFNYLLNLAAKAGGGIPSTIREPIRIATLMDFSMPYGNSPVIFWDSVSPMLEFLYVEDLANVVNLSLQSKLG
jgi:hypothetical protein